ncbi:Anti-sigma regulatory factor (Ser/Thr protein kinase) [Ruminococcaceae bacterium YRB3002]|nr:Anti-sigma regulatory factor (Ser/Thr protein kinase) [Ruminococcaceae bacterium YRB3002]
MKELDIKAVCENLPEVLSFVDEQLAHLSCSHKVISQIDAAVEEIFVNISSYAYDPMIGSATIRMEFSDDPLSVIISFVDGGVPYDPLAKPDPNLKIPVRDRRKGGLGIFIVKKTMDDVSYEYKDGQNILTIMKTLE